MTPFPPTGLLRTWSAISGVAALAIRQAVPTGVNIIGLQLGYFAGYTFLFALGIAAWRHDWLREFEWRQARPWIIGLIITWPLLPLGIFVARALNGAGKSNFSGGHSWTAILYAMWEPLVAWSLIAAPLAMFAAMVFGECLTGFFAVWIVHRGCHADGQIARTQRGWLKNIVSYSMFFHLEHHLFVFVPCWRLRGVHALLLAKGLGARMEVASGYLEVLRRVTATR